LFHTSERYDSVFAVKFLFSK